jgi:nitroimidazol reductase NimA-like FMN-containing flavoprotein (pyridoxamine 5'-phosphate oxidase superfamily)
MRNRSSFLGLVLIICFIAGFYSLLAAADTKKQKAKETPAKAQAIDVSAEVNSDHPEIPEGTSCSDCHEMKLDAKTTATQVWLNGEYLGKKKGEGVMTEDQLWKEIIKMIGGTKNDSKTYVLATCMNNRPLSTTAEWTLDPEKKMLYGVHEMGTEKLAHIKSNPWVSLNWHEEFTSIEGPYRCCQIKGRCQLIDGTNPEFEKILINFVPYEDAARRMMPKNSTPEQREQTLKNFRDQVFKKRFLISRITMDRVTVVNKAFMKQGFRNVQRWERKDNQEALKSIKGK